MTEKLIFRKEEFDKFDREKGIKQNYKVKCIDMV